MRRRPAFENEDESQDDSVVFLAENGQDTAASVFPPGNLPPRVGIDTSSYYSTDSTSGWRRRGSSKRSIGSFQRAVVCGVLLFAGAVFVGVLAIGDHLGICNDVGHLTSNAAMKGCPNTLWRATDGSDTGTTKWRGVANTLLGRYHAPGNFTADYDDRGRPNARLLSNALCAQTSSHPHSKLSALVWSFGQLLDHAISLSPEAHDGAPIHVDVTGDTRFDPSSRGHLLSTVTTDYGEFPAGYRQPFTVITHFVDGNVLYGSDSGRTLALRSFSGGELSSIQLHSDIANITGEYPPRNEIGFPNVGGRRNASMFLAGDPRANEQLALLAWHVIWQREHNRWARTYAAKYPDWTDECLYQTAKKMTVAVFQHVVYDEFLPALLGPAGDLPPPTGYNASVDPRIYVEFSKAAYRLHTLVTETVETRNPTTGALLDTIQLRDGFMRPDLLVSHSPDAVLLGMSKQPAEAVDLRIVDSLRNFLFANTQPALDLVTLNIVRGREVDVPDYATLRQTLGLSVPTSWADFPAASDEVRQALQTAYGGEGPSNTDAWISMHAERHVPGANFGPTQLAIIRDQFTRSRDGNPYYYAYDTEQYTRQEMAAVQARYVRDVILDNTEISPDALPNSVFVLKG